MRYIFIINPAAGSKNLSTKICSNINKYFQTNKASYKTYITTFKGEARSIVEKEALTGDKIRVYGFGGDGTLSELVVSSRIYENVEIGIFPTGSGNDYIKNYSSFDAFLDFDRQIKGESIEVDTIDTNEGSFINICSVGLDAKVAFNMIKYKKIPFVNGPTSYNLSLLKCLLGKLGNKISVKIYNNGQVQEFTDNFLFVLGASGVSYGGGYYGAPLAKTNDNLLDFILIKTPSLMKIAKLVQIYKKGRHLDSPLFKDLLVYCKGDKIELQSDESLYCNCDGECEVIKQDTFKLGDYKVKFILPAGLSY